MKLTTKGRYAVMAMVDVAVHSKGKEPISLSDVASRQDISLSYLEQLFGKLRKSGLVVSFRGPGGGYIISLKASEVRVADIILAVDEPLKVTRCQSGSINGCQGKRGRCLTHDLWDELSNQIYLFLSSVSLADIVEKRVLGASGALFQQARIGVVDRYNDSAEMQKNVTQ